MGGVLQQYQPQLVAAGQIPLLVLFVGVIGIGATTLAILWTMLQTWLGARDDRSDAAA